MQSVLEATDTHDGGVEHGVLENGVDDDVSQRLAALDVEVIRANVAADLPAGDGAAGVGEAAAWDEDRVLESTKDKVLGNRDLEVLERGRDGADSLGRQDHRGGVALLERDEDPRARLRVGRVTLGDAHVFGADEAVVRLLAVLGVEVGENGVEVRGGGVGKDAGDVGGGGTGEGAAEGGPGGGEALVEGGSGRALCCL
jgi:hypothetical protein